MRQFILIVSFVLALSAFGYGQSKLTEVYASANYLRDCGPLPSWDIMNTVPYHPKFTAKNHPTRFETRSFQKPTLACMQTSLPQYLKKNGYQYRNGYGYVVLPAGSEYGFVSSITVVYLGTPDTQYLRCYNDTLGIWETSEEEETFKPSTTPSPTPTPKVTPTPVPTPTPTPVVTPTPKDCPECPQDVDVDVFASGKTRLTGGWTGTALSAGIACAASGILNKSMEDCVRDAAISAVANRAVQAVNPSPDSVRITANGDVKSFRKGKPGDVGGCELTWRGSMAILSCGDQECLRVVLPKNLNTTVFAMKRERNGRTKTIPIKTTTPTASGGSTTRPRVILGYAPNGAPIYESNTFGSAQSVQSTAKPAKAPCKDWVGTQCVAY